MNSSENKSKSRFDEIELQFIENGKSEQEIKDEIKELIKKRDKIFMENGIETVNSKINSKK